MKRTAPRPARRRPARPSRSATRRSRPPAATPANFMESLEPRVLLAADPLLAPFPQAILANVGRYAAVVVDDIDGDGWSEILVGNAGGYSENGEVVFTSGAYLISGRSGEILREHEVRSSVGVEEGDRFGWSLAGLGDVDGDGVGDYAVGQPGRFFITYGDPVTRRVHIYSGATGDQITFIDLDGLGLWSLASPADSLLGLGDLNDDGVPDLAVGAPQQGDDGEDGAVFIFSGAGWTILNQISGFAWDFGRELWSAGDFDEDGVMDFISSQRVFSGATGDLLLTLDPGVTLASSDFWPTRRTIISIADLNDDGKREFAALVRTEDGREIVAFSGEDGFVIRHFLSFPSASTGEFHLGDIANVGDRTGDGFDEIALSINGQVQVLSSADGERLQTIIPPDQRFTTPGGDIGDGSYATSLATGDVNQDGRTDLIVISDMLPRDEDVPTGPGRTDLFLGQDVGESDHFGPGSLDPGSEFTIVSESGLVAAGVNREGDLIAFTRGSPDGPWERHVLAEEAGVLALDVFDDPRTGRLTIAASTYDGLKLFASVPSGWIERTIDDSAGRITRLMQAFQFADGRVGLVGMGVSPSLGFAEGIMLYEQVGAEWQFTNITLDLLVHRQPTAAFEEFTVYVAPWNAVHLTGRSSTGELVTVWHADHGEHWIATPIGAEVPEANQLSNLSAFVAPWGGLHVAGVTPEGHVGVLWWSPELTETGWEYTDLTAGINGPHFKQAHIAANVTGWGGLNIYGVNTDGDLTAYWWVPGAQWVAETLALNPGETALVSPARILDAIFEPNRDGMRITAASADGDAIIYTWQPAQGSDWLYENLTASAG